MPAQLLHAAPYEMLTSVQELHLQPEVPGEGPGQVPALAGRFEPFDGWRRNARGRRALLRRPAPAFPQSHSPAAWRIKGGAVSSASGSAHPAHTKVPFAQTILALERYILTGLIIVPLPGLLATLRSTQSPTRTSTRSLMPSTLSTLRTRSVSPSQLCRVLSLTPRA